MTCEAVTIIKKTYGVQNNYYAIQNKTQFHKYFLFIDR